MNDLSQLSHKFEALTYYLSFVYIFVKMNCVCKFEALPCEFGGCSSWQKWDVQSSGEIKWASPINVKDLSIPSILVNPNPCIWSIVCYLT
jgi:hypothetical protein